MVKKIKQRTKAQTPAPKKDQIIGSKKNPKGSASGSRGDIKISEATEKALSNMRDKHNEKYKSPSKKVDLGMLKAVYRRGAGAFSISHRPNVSSREQWALARVKAFLKLAGTGERKKAYNTDLDLLPKGHPQKTEKKTELLNIPDKYSHIDFIPPKAAAEAAERALRIRATKPPSQRGGTEVGLARARDLVNRKRLSPDTVKRMLAYFQRHEVDKEGSTWDDYGKGRQAWDLWGGNSAYTWSKTKVNQMKKADEKAQSLRAYGEAIQLDATSNYNIPDGLQIGKAFKTLSLGQVSSRMNGEKIGKEISSDLLEELVRVFKERQVQDPVIIDWQHATSPFNGGAPAPPESGNSLGLILDLELREDGLYAIPAYNERGLEVVKNAGGILWSSPEYIDGEVFSRDGGDKIGDAQLLAITLTPRPAQSHNKIDSITLSESAKEQQMNENEKEKLEELGTEALKAMILELQKQIAEMKAESEASLNAEHDDKQKMNNHYDAEKKAEEAEEMKEHDEEEKKKKMMEDEEKHKKLSESSNLLSEITLLKETVSKLTRENNEIKCKEAVSVLLNEGKITPAEEAYAKDAWNMKDVQPSFWNMFNDRPANSQVNLKTVGHSSSGQEINRSTLDQKIRNLSEEKNISYSEALSLFRENNSEFYNKAINGVL
jgi:hypothetical protein